MKAQGNDKKDKSGPEVAKELTELLGNEKSKPTVYGAIIATITMIVGMLILVPNIGIIGAAITSLTTYSAQASFLLLYSKLHKRNFR